MDGRNDKYQRWQVIRINQLGYVNNLILGLSLGLLAYNFNFIQPKDVELNCLQKILFWLGTTSIISSIFTAIILSINRLEDFRLTSQIVRKEEKNEVQDIETNRLKSKKMGKKTWCLFSWQVTTFSIGVLMSIVFIIIELIDKLI